MDTAKVVAGIALLVVSAAILAATGSGSPALPLALGVVLVGAGAVAWMARSGRRDPAA